MQDDFYINAVNGNAVIVSQNEEHISLGVHIRGGSCRIDLLVILIVFVHGDGL